MQKGKFNIVIGAQAGSESKGKLSAWLCDKHPPDLVVMTASPNAGHTLVINGKKKVSYHLPIGAVMCGAPILLGPASLIIPSVFEKEVEELGIADRVIVDPRASVITTKHIRGEKGSGLSDIGSTLQGISECRIGKMRRDGNHILVQSIRIPKVLIGDTSSIVNRYLDQGATVLCESTQGFDLDLEHGIHPVYCTSKMINPSMAMAEAGVAPSWVGDIYGVFRPYPIRVNNRTGTSGPYAGAEEITWEEVTRRCQCPMGITELTTTTKLPRRVFEFSFVRFERFVSVCRPTQLCLQFANYLDWSAYGVTEEKHLPEKVLQFIDYIEHRYHVPVTFVGTGPEHGSMIERRKNG